MSRRFQLLLWLVWAASSVRAADEVALVGLGEEWRFTEATPAKPPANGWQNLEFEDRQWMTGASGFGDTGYGENTPLKPLSGGWHTVLFRHAFVVKNVDDLRWIILRVDYAGGFCAWINGTEVARRGLPGQSGSAIPVDAMASPHPAGAADEIFLGPLTHLLTVGTNILAVEAHADEFWATRPVMVAELLANFTRAPYVQNVSQDHAAILWTTPLPVKCSVEYGANVRDQTISETSATNYHVALLDHLTPGTSYSYRVVGQAGNDVIQTDPRIFKTLTESGPLSVIVLGDSGGGSAGQFDVARHMRDEEADLVLHTGDVTYPSFADGLADTRFLSVYRPQMRTTPFYFAWGNHDLYSGVDAFLHTIRQPTNDVAMALHKADGTIPQFFGSFEAGDVHFSLIFQPFASQYLLRTNNSQFAWLDADLAKTRKPWKVLIAHHPWQTSGAHRLDDLNFDGKKDCAQIGEAIFALARKHGVQLFIGGHDHNYERFFPTNGLFSVTTGGGGSILYPLTQRDPWSAIFQSRYHFLRLRFDRDEMRVRAIGADGQEFDRFVMKRGAPPARQRAAIWRTPEMAGGPADDGDGNVQGQRHDFGDAEEIAAKSGLFTSPGVLRAALDRTNLYLGLDQAMLPPGADAYLFVGVPGRPGVNSLSGVGNGVIDPEVEGADGLDLAENVAFAGFQPMIGAILGDEFADGTFPNFRRAGSPMALGQGVFRLGSALTPVGGAKVQQFNQSPQLVPTPGEQNADIMELAIPRRELPGLIDGGWVQVAALVGCQVDTNRPARWFDSGFIGEEMTGIGYETISVSPVRIRLPVDPDPDGDGLTTEQEMAIGTDPDDPDTDRDGLLDGWEVAHGLNPLVATGDDGPDGDPDGDGLTNLEEQRLGSDPRDPASPLRLGVAAIDSKGFTLAWRTKPGRRYELIVADRESPQFSAVAGFPRAAAGDREQVVMAAAANSRYFQLRESE